MMTLPIIRGHHFSGLLSDETGHVCLSDLVQKFTEAQPIAITVLDRFVADKDTATIAIGFMMAWKAMEAAVQEDELRRMMNVPELPCGLCNQAPAEVGRKICEACRLALSEVETGL